jgi:hypothetical protein
MNDMTHLLFSSSHSCASTKAWKHTGSLLPICLLVQVDDDKIRLLHLHAAPHYAFMSELELHDSQARPAAAHVAMTAQTRQLRRAGIAHQTPARPETTIRTESLLKNE